MIVRTPEQVFKTWKELLLTRETFTGEDAPTLQDLVIDIREAGRFVSDADERDRLSRLARTVARAVAQISGTTEPATQIRSFEDRFQNRPQLELDGMPPPSRLFVGREESIQELDEALADSRCRILQVVGVGGQGKTQLVNCWLGKLQENQTSVGAIFCYSFYTFPSHTFKKVPPFIEEARTFFLNLLNSDQLKNSPREKWAEDLAWLVAAGTGSLQDPPRRLSNEIVKEIQALPPRILILDGLEAILYPKDGLFRKGATAIKELLKIFLNLNSGFCIITTRFKVGMLNSYESLGSVRTLNLDGLSDSEGGQLLGRLLGNGYTEKQLARVSRALGGHPVSILALGDILADQALGNPYLHQRISLESLIDEALQTIYEDLDAGGEIYSLGNDVEELLAGSETDADEEDLPTRDLDTDPTRHSSQDNADQAAIVASDAETLMDERGRGVIRSYLRYFADQGSEKGQITFQLARLMAFFEGATPMRDLQVLIRLEKGEGFNDKLQNYLFMNRELDQERLLELLDDLQNRQLIQERLDEDGASDIPSTYDIHPLLRSFFRAQLVKTQPQAWKMGHKALADHYANALSAHDPTTVPTQEQDILLHYRAVEHACQAEDWTLAYNLYWVKIHHNSENPSDDNYQWFAWEKYGLQSTDIRTLAFFYREPTYDNQSFWQTLEPNFKDKADTKQQVHIRIATSLCLLSLGFLKEAGEPLNSCYQSAKKANDNLTAAMLAGLLGDRFLLQGQMRDAYRWLIRALNHAKDQDEQARSKLAKLGNLYVYRGDWSEAKETFQKMLELHEKIVQADPNLPKYPFTRSGYYYSDYLLTIATLVLNGISPTDLGYHQDQIEAQDWALSKVREVYDGTRAILESGPSLNKHEESFNRVSNGWALGILSSQEKDPNFDEALQILEEARSIQEYIEQRQDLPRTLILLAHFLRKAKQYDKAMETINDCLAIAWTTEMRLYECDAYLIRCQIAYEIAMSKNLILDYYRTARRSIEEIRYGKRKHDLNLLRQELLKDPDISETYLPPLRQELLKDPDISETYLPP